MGRLVLRGAREPGDVAIANGRIAAIGAVGREAGDTELRCDGDIVTAGLVDAHEHLFQRIARGRADSRGLVEWLTAMWELWGRLTPDDVALAAEVALGELALAGATTVADHHYLVPHGDDSVFSRIVAVARRVGVRLVLCRGATDRPGLAPTHALERTDDCLASMERLILSAHDGDRVSVALAPGSLLAATEELFAGAAQLAHAHGLRLHTHLAETTVEAELCVAQTGRRPLELFDEHGWLEGAAWFAHAVRLEPAEIARLGRTRSGVAHCPSSNARLGSGACPVHDLRTAGVAVGLGTDGAAAMEPGVLAEARLAAYIARVRDGAAALTARAALDLATAGGADCVGRPDLGRLAVGVPADLAVWPADDLADVPDAVTALVLGPSRSVRHLVVGGDVVVRDGHCTGIDLERSRAELDHRAQELWT